MRCCRSSIQRGQLQSTCHRWLHEDAFIKLQGEAGAATRSTMLAEIEQGAQALLAHEPLISAINERHEALEATATQRLRWAAGANPTLQATLQQFEAAVVAKNQQLQGEGNVSHTVQTLCASILHLEKMRSASPEASLEEEHFKQLLFKYVCLYDFCTPSLKFIQGRQNVVLVYK